MLSAKVLLGFFTLLTLESLGQTITGKLTFEQGQQLDVSMKIKTTISQQAMGQAIDFVVDANALHGYTVTNAAQENTTLTHRVNKIGFAFDGMGQKKTFDSNNEKDLNGQFGKPVKDMLEKKYDIIIDSIGTVLLALPEKITLSEGDSRMAVITSMLKDVTDLVQPPQKGAGSFFKIFPAGAASAGATWTTSVMVNGGKVEAAYVINKITDSTILVDFAENSTTVTKAEMMGNPTTTTMNNKSKGTIIVDRQTGIMKEKSFVTESTGNTEATFGTLPVTSKTTVYISVTPIAK